MVERKTVRDYILNSLKGIKFVNADWIRYGIIDIFTRRNSINNWQSYSRIKYENDNIDVSFFFDIVNDLESRVQDSAKK